uniref:Uncharacterized protein n=1 Tax=Bicosoecida sp. CB-2014 TaxID=1486930 RepID=A0A7S1G984_9STRA|mmetsp:Transcript_25838/g.89977  ORF Transcript_25838/g.89977 Transcript_25838/m.89977 type:complete len:135 (+) Transcript_25838:170-574(+)
MQPPALLAVAVLVLGAATLAGATPVNNCTFVSGPTVSITLVNDCGSSAKIRTCASKFTQCVGYNSQPNHFQDCPARVPNGATVDLMLDHTRGYIVIDCPNWWGPTIDNWWTVEPKGGKWPASFTIPKPKPSARE